MSDFKNRYHAILQDIENHIQNEEERNFVIGKFQELSMVFLDIIDRLTYMNDVRIKEVEEKQQEIDNKLNEVKQVVDGIENDIYEEGEDYEFEIICPYCNYQFLADINSDSNTEVECPECHNIIELDWNGEEECEHECSHCMHDCLPNQDLVYEEETKPAEKAPKQEKIENIEDEDEEDDM